MLWYSSGLDAMAHVWDLRTGKCAIALEGHLRGVLAVAFAPDSWVQLFLVLVRCIKHHVGFSYSLATGSEDHSVKLWDLRKQRCIYTVPSHTNLVSQVKFQSELSICLPLLLSVIVELHLMGLIWYDICILLVCDKHDANYTFILSPHAVLSNTKSRLAIMVASWATPLPRTKQQ